MSSTPKVNVGDTVNLKPMKVFDVTSGGVWVVDTNDVRHFYSQDNIASVTRPALKVGDFVSFQAFNVSVTRKGVIRHIECGQAAVWSDSVLFCLSVADLTRIGGAE